MILKTKHRNLNSDSGQHGPEQKTELDFITKTSSV